MRWLLLLLLLTPLALAEVEIIDERTSIEHHEEWSLLTSHIEEHFYDDSGVWRVINTTLEDDPAPQYDYKVDKFTKKVQFKDKPNTASMVKLTKQGHELSFTPKNIGYYSEWGEVSMKAPTTNLGHPNNNKMKYDRYWGEGINLTFSIRSEVFSKEITIASASLIPPAPESVMPPYCTDNCTAPPVYGYIDYALTTPAGASLVVDGLSWDFESTITTENEITLYNSTGGWLYTIHAPYAILNYTGEQAYSVSLSSMLYKQGGTHYLRMLIPLHILNSSTSYPLFIDPTVSMSNHTSHSAFDNYNYQCNQQGPCCSPFYTGNCNLQSDLSPTCTTQSNQGLTLDAVACQGCSGAIDCCTTFGNTKNYHLLGFNWSSAITQDYAQVVVNYAEVNTSITSPNGFTKIFAKHQSTYTGSPICAADTPGGLPQPASQFAASLLSWNFTDHVQYELDNNDNLLFIVLDSDNSNTASNIPNGGTLEINYTINECLAPFSGDWELDCACGTLTENENVTGDVIIWDSSDTAPMLTLMANWTFTSSNQRLIINESCTLAIKNGGGLQ